MNKLKYILGALFIGTLIQSCNIDKYPEDSIELSQSFKTVSDAKYWDNGFYSYFRGRVYGIYTYVTDIQADQLNATVDYGNRLGSEHRWTDFLSGNYELRDIYSGYYSGINNINTALEGFATIPLNSDAEKSQMSQYIGDAHFARAYYYFNLALRFGKAYNSTTASSDLAVPLVLTPDLEGKPARATMEAVYKQILADLSVAKTNLASIPGKVASTRFTIDAVTALETRVKFYMGDWAGARSGAESLINGGLYPLVKTQDDLKKLWFEDSGAEVIYQPKVSRPDELPNTISPTYGYSTANSDYRPDFLPSKWVVDKFSDNDFRKSIYFLEAKVTMMGKSMNGIVVNKFAGSTATGLNINKGTNYVAPKVFRIAEYYLIAAESAYKSGNEALALKYLNLLRVSRGLSAVATSGNVLFNDIKDERFRELAFEGFRLDDLKRWGEGFQRRDPQSFDLVRDGSEFSSKKVDANDPKFIWGLPENDVTINPNLIQNNGW
ncbi:MULTISPECIES: RagB/SusD family nutrient uptake outer membrane protein [Sphingobacterium]|uniref:RagB/SusD family nutrient uptake outer membrane protein n=1 Tax=Sphingobacterium TaxID=28453 RepID=UPI002580A662|nr:MULTISPECIES: RagB/SusD family nutrient uptake outer membrane protein [Sphingobacterium]